MRRLWLWLLLLCLAPASFAERPVVIASKFGAEPLILSEMLIALLHKHGVPVERKLSLGPTEICFPALQSGQIDLYVEYTGTGLESVLREKLPENDPLQSYLHVKRRFAELYKLDWLEPFGFENSFALAVPRQLAEKRGWHTLSDLAGVRDLRAGFDHQFLNRPDQFPALARAYNLKFSSTLGMEHALAYQALQQGRIDVVEAYTTDGELSRLELLPLADDRSFFPHYQAAPLVRSELLERYPELPHWLAPLAFSLNADTMRSLNLQVLQGADPAQVAARFLESRGQRVSNAQAAPSPRMELMPKVVRHLQLTLGAVSLALLVGLPLGIYVSSRPRLAGLTLGLAGVIQTIPGIALLAFFIAVPGLGLGVRSALAALFLYGLLPILRNTVAGLHGVDPLLREAALGLGMRPRQVLWWVELPLAFPTIMAGLRTCAVITVGSATLAAFIGAGGLGEPIVTGLQLNDKLLVLSGAVPSALLAVLVDQGLGWLEGRARRVPAS